MMWESAPNISKCVYCNMCWSDAMLLKYARVSKSACTHLEAGSALLCPSQSDLNNHIETILIITLFGQWLRHISPYLLYHELTYFYSSVHYHIAMAYQIRFWLLCFYIGSYMMSLWLWLLSLYISSSLTIFCPAMEWRSFFISQW